MKASQSCIGRDSRLGAYLPGSMRRRAPATSVSVGTIVEANASMLGDEAEGASQMKEVKDFLMSSNEVKPGDLKEADK